MAEPESHTLRLLRELRDDIKTLDHKVDAGDSKINALDAKVDRNHEEVKERIDRFRQEYSYAKDFLGARQGAQVFKKQD